MCGEILRWLCFLLRSGCLKMEGEAGHEARTAWCLLARYSLSLKASLFRLTKGSFPKSAGHLSAHTFILLFWDKVPCDPGWLWTGGHVVSVSWVLTSQLCIVWSRLIILCIFVCSLVCFKIGQTHMGVTIRFFTLLRSSVLCSSWKRPSLSVSPCSIWATAAVFPFQTPLSPSRGWNPGTFLHQLFAFEFLACGLKLPGATLSLNLRMFLLTQCHLIRRHEI